eukprot:6972986-Alexandrium_andersonii.AAC.1
MRGLGHEHLVPNLKQQLADVSTVEPAPLNMYLLVDHSSLLKHWLHHMKLKSKPPADPRATYAAQHKDLFEKSGHFYPPARTLKEMLSDSERCVDPTEYWSERMIEVLYYKLFVENGVGCAPALKPLDTAIVNVQHSIDRTRVYVNKCPIILPGQYMVVISKCLVSGIDVRPLTPPEAFRLQGWIPGDCAIDVTPTSGFTHRQLQQMCGMAFHAKSVMVACLLALVNKPWGED